MKRHVLEPIICENDLQVINRAMSRVYITDLADELNVLSLDVLDDHDLHLGQEMQCQVTHCVSVHRTREHIDSPIDTGFFS